MEVVLEFERATKNTYRYQEIIEAGKPPVIRTMYVQKWVLGNNPPQKIKVKIETL